MQFNREQADSDTIEKILKCLDQKTKFQETLEKSSGAFGGIKIEQISLSSKFLIYICLSGDFKFLTQLLREDTHARKELFGFLCGKPEINFEILYLLVRNGVTKCSRCDCHWSKHISRTEYLRQSWKQFGHK